MKWNYNLHADNSICLNMTEKIKNFIEREIEKMTNFEFDDYMHKAYLEYDLAPEYDSPNFAMA